MDWEELRSKPPSNVKLLRKGDGWGGGGGGGGGWGAGVDMAGLED